ncbi:MAG: DUF4384 domain-containing protein [Marinobacterium sp.]|nr:DUF4384 domain-containing protein [Marinobacterium sp.]
MERYSRPPLTLLLAGLCSLFSAHSLAQAPVQFKGPSHFCNNRAHCADSWQLSVNPWGQLNPDSAPAELASIPPSDTMALLPSGLVATKSVEVNYRWSPPNENGRRYLLDNGERLYSGDEFTIDLKTTRPGYLYLLLTDSAGKVFELVRASGYQDNYFTAGEKRSLPAQRADGKSRHFTLDAQPGTEHFQLLVSDTPLTTLVQQATSGRLALASHQPATKGIQIAVDRQSRPVNRGKRTLICDAGQPYCSQSFTIHHLAGRRP